MRDRGRTNRKRIEDLEMRSRRTLTGANGGSSGGGSSITLPIAESNVTNLVSDLATLTAAAAYPFYDGLFFDCRCNGTTAPAGYLTNCAIQFAVFSGSATAAYNATLGSWAWNWVITQNALRRATLNDGGAASPACYSRDMYPSLMGRMMFNSLIDTQYFFGFSAGDPLGYGTTIPANTMMFRYENGTDTNWQCLTKSGTTLSTADSGIPVAITTKYKLEIKTNTSGNVEFYINDALVVTATANLPVNTTKISGQVGHLIFQKAASVSSADVTIQGIRFNAPVH